MAKSLRSKRRQKIKRLRKKLFYEKDKAKESVQSMETETMEEEDPVRIKQQDSEAAMAENTDQMDTGTKVISDSQWKKVRQDKQRKKLKRLKKKRLGKGRF